MANYLEIAKKYNLTLTEISILVALDKNYPRSVTIDELTENENMKGSIKGNMEKLKSKKLAVEWSGSYLRKRKHD